MDFDSKPDYDNDGLLNAKEIDWNSPLIKDKSLKTYESLPTVQECIGYFAKTKELTYVENGLERFKTSLSKNKLNQLFDKLVLIVKSDPTKIDGDGDGIADGTILVGETKYTNDEKPLKYSFKYYDDELQKVKQYYPNAKFEFYETNIDFKDFVYKQYNHNNPTPKAEDYTKYGAEYTPNEFVEIDDKIILERTKQGAILSDGQFFLSTYSGVEYYIDPRTYLNKINIFAFFDMKSNSNSADLVQAKTLLKNTYFDQPDKLDIYAQAFVDAANKNGMDLTYLVAKCIIEAEAGTKGKCSKLCSGVLIEDIKYYNLYGIGANDGNATKNGAEYAKKQGWISQELAIIGGAQWINENYVLLGKNTLYKQRYNVLGYLNNGEISGQYASDIAMAYSKGRVIYSKSYDMLKDEYLVFEIPIYNNY